MSESERLIPGMWKTRGKRRAIVTAQSNRERPWKAIVEEPSGSITQVSLLPNGMEFDGNTESPYDLMEYAGKISTEEPEHPELVRRQVGGDHYLNMGLQPVDVIEATFTPDEVRGFYKGLILKHTMRAGKKPGDSNLQEFGKAQHYAEKLLAYERKQKAKGE